MSNGELLDGVRFTAEGATTSSLVMRYASGTVREIKTHHRWKHPASLRKGLTAVQQAVVAAAAQTGAAAVSR